MIELLGNLLPVLELVGLFFLLTSFTMFIDAYKLAKSRPNNLLPYILFVIGGLVYLSSWRYDPESAKVTGGLALAIYVAWLVCTGRLQR